MESFININQLFLEIFYLHVLNGEENFQFEKFQFLQDFLELNSFFYLLCVPFGIFQMKSFFQCFCGFSSIFFCSTLCLNISAG
jgi:hypothetical protein